jgi:hypothetical protein
MQMKNTIPGPSTIFEMKPHTKKKEQVKEDLGNPSSLDAQLVQTSTCKRH